MMHVHRMSKLYCKVFTMTEMAMATDLVVSSITVEHLWADVQCRADVPRQAWCCCITSNTFILACCIWSIQCQLRQASLHQLTHEPFHYCGIRNHSTANNIASGQRQNTTSNVNRGGIAPQCLVSCQACAKRLNDILFKVASLPNPETKIQPSISRN